MWVGGCATALAAWASGPSALASRGPWGRRRRGTSGPARSRVRLWGRRSVHRSAEMASRRRFGAFVYTVVTVGLGCGWPWDRNSVHKWEDRASPRRIGAFVYTVGLLRCCGQTWGRRSVHRLAKMASPRRFGAFVYTVATRVTIRIASRAASGGTSASTTMACRRLLAGPSRLVGKTNSERAAPLPGWHLGRGVNPHEPLKSPLSQCRPEGSQRQPGKSAIVNSSRASTPCSCGGQHPNR